MQQSQLLRILEKYGSRVLKPAPKSSQNNDLRSGKPLSKDIERTKPIGKLDNAPKAAPKVYEPKVSKSQPVKYGVSNGGGLPHSDFPLSGKNPLEWGKSPLPAGGGLPRSKYFFKTYMFKSSKKYYPGEEDLGDAEDAEEFNEGLEDALDGKEEKKDPEGDEDSVGAVVSASVPALSPQKPAGKGKGKAKAAGEPRKERTPEEIEAAKARMAAVRAAKGKGKEPATSAPAAANAAPPVVLHRTGKNLIVTDNRRANLDDMDDDGQPKN